MASIFGDIDNPLKKISSSGYGDLEEFGLMNFISNLIKFAITAAGLFAFINMIIAGWIYLAANGQPEQIAAAWRRMYMSLIGLAVMVASFAIAAIAGKLLLGEWMAILNPQIYGPGR